MKKFDQDNAGLIYRCFGRRSAERYAAVIDGRRRCLIVTTKTDGVVHSTAFTAKAKSNDAAMCAALRAMDKRLR